MIAGGSTLYYTYISIKFTDGLYILLPICFTLNLIAALSFYLMTHLTDPGLIPRRQFFEVPNLIDRSKEEIDLLLRGNELNIKDRESIATKRKRQESEDLIKDIENSKNPEVASNIAIEGTPDHKALASPSREDSRRQTRENKLVQENNQDITLLRNYYD